MPGGLTDEPQLDDDDDDPLVGKKPEDGEGTDFENDLLIVPPGWEAGMTFEKKVVEKVEEKKEGEIISTSLPSSGAVGLDDILGDDDRFDYLEKETEEKKADKNKQEKVCSFFCQCLKNTMIVFLPFSRKSSKQPRFLSQ